MLYIEFITGFIISIIYSYFMLPNKCGNTPKINPTIYPFLYKGMIIIPLYKKALHIHHWIFYLIILLTSIFFYIPQIIIGFSVFLFLQGLLQYNDRFSIFCNNPYL